MSNNSKKRKKKIIYNICMIVLICIFVCSGIYLGAYFWQTKRNEDKVNDLKKLIDYDSNVSENHDNGDLSDASVTDAVNNIEYVTIDGVNVQKKFKELYAKNHDFMGWLTIDGTDIDYPVMQSLDDEEYYLHRDFDKTYSYPGTLFIDTSSDVKSPSDNILIYGHHMQSGKMFGKLEDYADKDYYENHRYIFFDTIYGDGTYEVIAAFYSKIYDKDYDGFKYYQFFDAYDKEQFDYYVSNCKALTSYDISETAEYGDKLISLSTCAYHTTNGRFVVVAKKIN